MRIDLKEVGKRIRRVRGGNSLIEFEKIVGIGKNMISLYEHGEAWPKPHTLDKIIELSGRPSDWLLYGVGDNADTVAEDHLPYHPTPEEENLLKILEEVPDVREAMEAMMALPPRKQKIYLGKMLEDLEKLEEGKD